MDVQSFYSGNEFEMYRYMGAHAGAEGTRFRVFAPHATAVGVIGEFCGWQEIPMNRCEDGSFWECTVAEAKAGHMYKYRIHRPDGKFLDHADPYAFLSERRPGTASVISDPERYEFHDEAWIKAREDHKDQPLNIYEVHLGSWKRTKPAVAGEDPGTGWMTYREMAVKLVPYLKENGYNALEVMPLAEYPADESWGYQGTGFFSATSRYGTPNELCELIDVCHAAGISVIHDVVTVHFAVNDYALANFDGQPLYEYPNPADGISEWGTHNFNHARGDVRSFLQSSCNYWLEEFHFDGLRFDAVSNLIYRQGNRGENRDAIHFLQVMNRELKWRHPGVMLIAEDSTMYPGTTVPVDKGGLGFDYKWNLGWMNDTLAYMKMAPDRRAANSHMLIKSTDYMYQATYVLPLSHDEVVHMKGTIVQKVYGDFESRMRQLRAYYMFMYMHPGKKLNFMGNEVAMTREWNEHREPDWDSLKAPIHHQFWDYMGALSRFYLDHPAMWEKDYDRDGFHWTDANDPRSLIYSFRRTAKAEELVVVFNFSDQKRACRNPFGSYHDGQLLFASTDDSCSVQADGSILLPPYSGYIWKQVAKKQKEAPKAKEEKSGILKKLTGKGETKRSQKQK